MFLNFTLYKYKSPYLYFYNFSEKHLIFNNIKLAYCSEWYINMYHPFFT